MDQEVDRILSELRRSSVTPRELAADSRALARGDLFLAYPGEHADGRRFIADAIARGAGAVLWERDGFAWPDGLAAPNLAVDGLKRLAGPLAAEIYGRPSEQLWMVGVTGTNGKTSCSSVDRAGARRRRPQDRGDRHARQGLPGRLEAIENTTPDAVVLQRALARFHRDGAQGVAMEVSSIGLEQDRVEGVRVRRARSSPTSRATTSTITATWSAMRRRRCALFAAPALAHAVLNLDDAFGVRIAAALAGSGVERIGYSASPGVAAASGLEHWLEAHDVDPYGVDPYGVDPHGVGSRAIDPAGAGLRFRLESSRGGAPVESSLVGRFNVANLLGASACCSPPGSRSTRPHSPPRG